jgi:transcriptional regulator with XRE-family HTH domain
MATLVHELQVLELAHDALGLTYQEIARIIRADESTLHRWRSGETGPSPVFLARLDAFGEFLAELRRTFKDWDAGKRWLDQSVPYLAGETPRNVLRSGRVEKLTALLGALNAGIFS